VDVERDDVDYILETFPIVKRKDVEKHGDYRTKLVILDIYDRLQDPSIAGSRTTRGWIPRRRIGRSRTPPGQTTSVEADLLFVGA